MKLTWATDYAGIGNSYGYSVYNARSREAIRAAGVELVPDAEIVLHVAPGHRFEPIPGKLNILYTAWEMEELPPRYLEAYSRADALIVTARFLMDVVKRYLPEKPVYLCPLGVDTETFWYRQRKKGEPFRFLWVGAPNARKGWEIVLEGFRPFFGDPRFELYIKTTVTEKVVRERNVIFDSRNMTPEELCALYHSAHAFVFPSFGEGFGLTMAEAMATGLAPIFTPWSSMTDLADGSCGYPVRYRMIRARVRETGGIEPEGANSPDSIICHLAQADTASVAEAMAHIYHNWKQAQTKGERAAKRIGRQFTWQRTGLQLKRICEELLCPQAQV